jgi:DNA-binding transcriptional MocR family regulator
MRELYRKVGPSRETVCAAYAQAERNGLVDRRRNINGVTPEQDASRLFSDVRKRGGFG